MPKTKYQKEKGNGLYFANVPTGEYDANGKPKYKKLRGKTVAALDAKVDEFKKNKALNVQPQNVTVKQWYAVWLDTYKANCKPTTREWYKGLYTRHVDPSIGAMQVSAVKEAHCQQIISSMAGAAQQTQKSVRYVMSSLFDTAIRNKLIANNPAEKVAVRSAKPKKKRRSLTPSERTAYLGACGTDDFGVFAAFLFYLGLRRGECLAITSDDIGEDTIRINKQYVYPKNHEAQLSTPKTAAGVRELPIPNGLRPYIDRIRTRQGLIFSSALGQPLTYTMVVKRWNRFIRTALGSDTDITMHYVRHNYCTMLFEQGVDIQTAKYLMGHDDIKTTMQIYAHYSEELQHRNLSAVLKIGDPGSADTV